MQFRYLLLVLLSASVHAAKLDPKIYPNANVYRDPAIENNQYAKVIREFCPGLGRGQIHFLDLDDKLIRIRKTWPTYLELAPGTHQLKMEFIGTASDIWSTWNGTANVSETFEAGKTYLVRYKRTAVNAFLVRITPYSGFDAIDKSTTVCDQSAFPDVRVHL